MSYCFFFGAMFAKFFSKSEGNNATEKEARTISESF